MKKSTLALSVAAALGGLSLAGSVMAMGAITAGTATSMVVNADGIGHQLVVPYFSTQSGNQTLMQITNHDLVNGKLVKVRFRGAANSDDLYDFTLLLSPGDVWTAAVTKDATTGKSRLKSTDKSCVLPATANDGEFSVGRTDQTLTGDASAAQTREGYIEILNMADLPPAQPAYSADKNAAAATNGALFTAVKHVNGVAPCTAAVLDNNLGSDAPTNAAVYVQNDPSTAGALTRGMGVPTGLLSADWILINQEKVTAWSGAATALQAKVAAANSSGALTFWPQKFGTPAIAIATATADPLLVGGVVAPQWYDLPDLSTPYLNAEANGAARADALAATLQVASIAHQIVTTSDIAASTDLVLSQPSRRYHVAVNYKAIDATAPNVLTTTGSTAVPVYRAGQTVYAAANTAMGAAPFTRVVCINKVNAPSVQSLFDREETSPTVGSTEFVISPNTPSAATVLQLCGETSVVSINQGSISNPSTSVSGSIARSDVTFAAGYAAGWATWNLTSAGNPANGYPMIANTFLRAVNGVSYYGFNWPAKVTRN